MKMAMDIDLDTLRTRLRAATMVAMSCDADGNLPDDYKTTTAYKASGFVEVNSFCKASPPLHDKNVGIAGCAKLSTDPDDTALNVVVAFKGTDLDKHNPSDWPNNFLAWQQPFWVGGRNLGGVHMGFLGSAQSLEDIVLEQTKGFLEECDAKAVLYVAGHSKGAAVATLMSKYLEEAFSGREIVTYAFGSPRVGDEAFHGNYKLALTRHESFLDIVPHVCFSAQEKSLTSRLSEGYTVFTVFADLLNLPTYRHVGDYVCYYNQENATNKEYKKLPHSISNKLDESLNSYCNIEQALRESPAIITKLLGDIHNDYYNSDVDKLAKSG
jgi:hypothetical protein